jgi:hypothetical protein
MLKPWRSFAAGCHCNRPTVDLMRTCGFEVAAEHAAWRGMPPIIRPLVVGCARLSASGGVRPQPAS